MLLIKQHGSNAEDVATGNMLHLMERDDVKGASVCSIERDRRFGNAESAKTSPLSRFLGSTAFLFIILLGLDTLAFGWVIYPPLGMLSALLNVSIVIGICVAAMVTPVCRRKPNKASNGADGHGQ
jgi:hypothetical protein